ncbi:MAG TPA: FAD:protein FMN transferase [Opitutaceae bacterium]|nr:FAD:protein FMN transferase [Opitutaceae bacterium]
MSLVSSSHRVTPPEPNGHGAALALRRLSFSAMGTPCEVQYVAPNGDVQAQAFERAAVGWVTAFEAKYSRFRSDSLVSRINAAAGCEWVDVDADMELLLKLCDTLHVMTQGVLDPTALPLIRLWNYKAEQPRLPAPAEIDAARALVGWTKVERAPGRVFLPQPGMALDFGGFGKEYAVDMVAQLALERGIPAVLVDFGHDLRAVGAPPGRPAWHIGLEDPRQPGRANGSFGLRDRGVASSGDYLRCFVIGGRRYGHIIDPRTGYPVANGCSQATVIAPSCLQAGVLSTTAFVLGVPRGLELIQSCPGAEGLIVTERTRAQTRGFYHYVCD